MQDVRHTAVKNPVKYCFILSPLWLKSLNNLAIDKRTRNQHNLNYVYAVIIPCGSEVEDVYNLVISVLNMENPSQFNNLLAL